MITTNSAWDTKNAEMAKRPIYALAISGEGMPAGHPTIVYTSHSLAAMGITGTLPEYYPWLRTPQGASQSVDVVNGSSSIGKLTCEVVDVGGAVRVLIGQNAIEGGSAVLSVGYPGIAWTEFVPLHSYVIEKITPKAGYGAWVFTCRDRQWLEKRTIRLHPENGEPISADNPWFLCGTPAEIFQAVALFGLALPADAVDRTGLAALDSAAEGLYCAARPFQFRVTEALEAKQWLESEIFKAAGVYQVVTNTGKLSLRASRPPAAGVTIVFTFTDDNMVILPAVDRMAVVNEAVWQIDKGENDFGNKIAYLEETSITTYGRGQQFSVDSAGLRTELGAWWFTRWVTDRLFRRFAGTPSGLKGGAPVVDIEAFFLSLPVWLGDYVAVTHPLMPDMLTGALGVTGRVYEVIDRSPDYANGRMKYKLLDTGLTGLEPAHQWGAGSARPFLLNSSLLY